MKSFVSQISDLFPLPLLPPGSPFGSGGPFCFPVLARGPALAQGRAKGRLTGNMEFVAFCHGKNRILLFLFRLFWMLPVEISMVLFSKFYVETFSLLL